MSAETLRRAASLMRERAESALHHSPSPWTAHEGTCGDPANGPTDMRVSDNSRLVVAVTDHCLAGCQNAEHIASWHPAVALAVADWLDATASELDRRQRHVDDLLIGVGATGSVQIEAADLEPQALAVARVYLGEPS